jgi:3-oxoacyl-[acyl-carrier-protein] synthase II
MKRVAITGIGLVTALGVGTEETWDGLIAGRSGVGPLQAFDASSLRTRLGGEIRDFNPQGYVANRRTLRMMTRGDQLSVVAATIAMRDAGAAVGEGQAGRAGLFVGGNKEISDPMHVLEATLLARNEDGTVDLLRFGESAFTSAYPLFYVEGLQAGSLFYVSQAFGLKGANTYFAGTAEAGATAIGSAYRAIRRGEADVAIAGGFDDAVSWWNLSKFDAFDVLTERNELGAAACRPYDKDHSGTVFGEGAAFLVLEDYEAATGRGARIYAELTGYGHAYDNYKLLTPHPEGRGLVGAIRAALRDAGSAPEAVAYVASHGCGTPLGDTSEARALRTAFGPAAVPPASSVKPATGHLVAAAGALNAAVAALATYHQVVPPTLNFRTPAPDCDLDWVPGEARPVQIGEALAVARGLEGQNVALAMRAAR